MDLTREEIEQRLVSVEASFQRLLNLVGKPGYDQSLALALKKDIDWLKEQRERLLPLQTTAIDPHRFNGQLSNEHSL